MKITKYISIIAFISLLVVIGSLISFRFLAIESIGGCEVSKYKLEPLLGSLKCVPIKEAQEHLTDIPKGGVTIRCGDTENTPECSIEAYCSNTDFWAGVFATDLVYKYDGSEKCPIEGTIWCHKDIVDFDEYVSLPTLKKGERLSIFCSGRFENQEGKIKEKYTQFGLRQTKMGVVVKDYDLTTCDITKTGVNPLSVCIAGKDCPIATPETVLDFWEEAWYVYDWVLSPKEMRTLEYNGETVYCLEGNLYTMTNIKLKSGECYWYRDKFIVKAGECCPGVELAGKNLFCNNDFEWELKIKGECTIDTDCPKGYKCVENKCVTTKLPCFTSVDCPGEGIFTCDTSTIATGDLKAVRWACENNFCELKETKSVECCPPAYNCPNGYVCYNFECVLPKLNVVCGDGICLSLIHI